MSEGSLPLKSLTVDDFSGGLTDYFLFGDQKRYEKADNLEITIDKQLLSRPGSVGFDANGNHILPGSSTSPRRVDGFLLFNNKTKLLAHQGADLYYLNSTPAWTKLTGPSGNAAVTGGNMYSHLSSSEWRGHAYFAVSSGGRPGKIYCDSSNALQVRTAGLPTPYCNPKYTSQTLLLACINLANALRASMVAHMGSYSTTATSAGPVAGSLHGIVDKWSLSYFSTQSFVSTDVDYPGPSTIPTPAVAATDQASLFLLVKALNAAYEHHALDPFINNYHYVIALANAPTTALRSSPRGPFRFLTDNSTPTTVLQAAAQLDELRTQWNWHRLAMNAHTSLNDFSTMDVYPINAPCVGNTDTLGVPSVTSNYTRVIAYAKYLRQLFNAHASSEEFSSIGPVQLPWHSQPLTALNYQLVTLPEPTTLEAAKRVIYWVWGMLEWHIADSGGSAGYSHLNITMSTTADSANVTSVANTAGAVTLPVGSWVISGQSNIYNDAKSNGRRAAKVTASGSGTATLSKPLTGTVGSQAAQWSSSYYHGSYDGTAGTLLENSALAATFDELLTGKTPGTCFLPSNNTISDILPATLEAWMDLAYDLYVSLNAHIFNLKSHPTSYVDMSQYIPSLAKPAVSTYNYAFVYKSAYTTTAGLEIEVRSEPIFIGPFDSDKIEPVGAVIAKDLADLAPSTPSGVGDEVIRTLSSIALSNLPVLANDYATNYSTSDLVVEVYRTTDDGTAYYLEDEVANGTTTYTDSIADELDNLGKDRLSVRDLIYVSGGKVAHTQAPEARFVHILQDIAYYAYITDTGQTFKDQIIQSIPGVPDSGPGDFSLTLPAEITGISSARNVLVAFCKYSIYRITGGFNELGQGLLAHESISDEIGCISGGSIVQTEIGLFFAGNDGFYHTDGYQNIKISIDLNLTYAARTQTDDQSTRIKGSYDRLTRRIKWTTQSNPTDTDCDEIFVYYLDYGVKPSGVFTGPWKNGAHFRPSAVEHFKGQMIRGDARGLVFKHDSLYLGDPKVPSDLSTALSSFGVVYIPWLYRSCALTFGETAQGQWVTGVHYLGENRGNVDVQISGIADNRGSSTEGRRALAPIRYTDNLIWGDPSVGWGDSTVIWGPGGKLDYRRKMPAGTLRSQIKQVEFAPAYVGIYRYDDYPQFATCSVNATTKIATLSQPTGYTALYWPLDAVDMHISFESDDYTNEFQVSAVSTTALTFLDPSSLLTADLATQKWVIRGYRKEARLSLASYDVKYASLGERGRVYSGKDDRGENG